jgi:hypothetical protein
MSIILNTALNDASLPLSGSLVEQIKAIPSLKNWHRTSASIMAPANPTNGTLMDTLGDLAGKDGVFGIYQDANKPKFAQGQLNGQDGLQFDGTSDFLAQFGTSWTLANPFTMVVLYRADPSVNSLQVPLGAYDSNAVVTGVLQNGDAISMRHGSADLGVAMARGTNVLAFLSSDTVNIRGRVNGVDYGPVATNNAVPATAPRIGALDNGTFGLLKGYVFEVLFFTENLLIKDRASVSLIERYACASRVYGLPFKPLIAG